MRERRNTAIQLIQKVHNITQESNKVAENLRNREKVSDG